MLRSFTVKNFRCLEDFEIRNLARVNLIVGDNNSGKTALLEALYIHRLQDRVEGVLDLKVFRNDVGAPSESYWLDLFSRRDGTRPIRFTSADEQGYESGTDLTLDRTQWKDISAPARGTKRATRPEAKPAISPGTLELAYRSDGPDRFRFFTDDLPELAANSLVFDSGGAVFRAAHRSQPVADTQYFSTAALPDSARTARDVSHVLVAKQKSALLRVVQAIDSKILDLSIATPNDVPEVFFDTSEDQLVPLASMGSGLIRATAIAASVPQTVGGLVLVDEIENGVYYRRFDDLWKGLDQMSRAYNVQIVASTHSLECVDAAIKAITADDKDADPLHVYRMRRGKNRPMPYEGEVLQSVPEFHAEVR
jgi:hypothetical protein